MRTTIIMLIESIAAALGADFRPYLPDLLPYMLRVFMHDDSHDKIISEQVIILYILLITNILFTI